MVTITVQMPPSIVHARLRALQRELDGIVHCVLYILLESFDFRMLEMAFAQQMLGQTRDIVAADFGEFCIRGIFEFEVSDRDRQRIDRLVGFDFNGWPIGARIGHRMAPVAVRLELEELRAAVAADAISERGGSPGAPSARPSRRPSLPGFIGRCTTIDLSHR